MEVKYMDKFINPIFRFSSISLANLILVARIPKPKVKIKIMILIIIDPIYYVLYTIFKRIFKIKRRFRMIKSLYTINCQGTVMMVNGINYVLKDYTSLIVIHPVFEWWMWNYLKPQKGETFVDVGAHIGKYACRVAKIVGEEGRVIAVEADPENFKIPRRNIDLNGLRNVQALNIAAWNKIEELNFYRACISSEGSVKSKRGYNYFKVKAIPLDYILSGIKVDWVKIDVEGAELEVLEGLEQTLEKYRPNIIIEVSNHNVKKVMSFMREKRYTAKIINKNYFLFY